MAFMGLLPSFGSSLVGGGMGGGSGASGMAMGGAAYGLLMSSLGLGSILGPLTLAAVARRTNSRRMLVATALLSGLTLALMGAMRTLPLAAVAAVTVGISESLYMTLLYNQSQGLSAEAMRGRVASFTFFFTSGVMGLFNLAFGLLATVVAPSAIMEVTGLAFVLATFALLARVPALRWSPPLRGAEVAAVETVAG
jgi:MFS family permease